MGTLAGVKDAELMRRVCREVAYLSGVEVQYWRLDRASSPKDPLYGEPTQDVYDGPYTLTVLVEHGGKDVSTGEEGLRREYEATVWLPVNEWIESVGEGAPWLGDQVEAWGKRWLVTEVGRSGIIDDDRATFAQYRLTLRLKEKYAPERRGP